jgi:predicted amidophosphoribosyltransferase
MMGLAADSEIRDIGPPTFCFKLGSHSDTIPAVQTGGALVAAIEALLPGMCPHCDHLLTGGDRGLCGSCWSLTVPRVGNVCPLCGVASDDASEPCLSCDASPPPQCATVVWGEHHGALRTAILALKHGGRDDLARPLGERLAARIAAEEWAKAIDAVAAVPSHPWRRLKKPWVASELLAQIVAGQLGKPMMRPLRRHGLGRQTGRTRSRRLELPGKSFSASVRADGRRLLLIDDVTTTGTTLRRAASALYRAGATAVYCGVLAQTPDSRRYA